MYARKDDEPSDSHAQHQASVPVRSQKERLALFGTELGNLRAGRTFGEMVLTSERKERNATLIADEPTELITVDEELYKRSFKMHDVEWQEKSAFVSSCPLFESWPATYKSFLIENLKVGRYHFGNRVVKQGSVCGKVIFIAKGWAKVVVDPRLSFEQYNALKPNESLKKKDKDTKNLQTSEDEAPEPDATDPLQSMNVIQRRRHRLEHGYVAMETRLRRREVQVTTIGPNDVIGDIEIVLDLPTYVASVECVESLQVYELDKLSFHRLSRRNPETLDLLTQVVIAKLHFRQSRLPNIPLFTLLLQRVTATPEKEKHSKKKRQTTTPTGKTTAQRKAGKTAAMAVQFVRRLEYAATRTREAVQNVQTDSKATTSGQDTGAR